MSSDRSFPSGHRPTMERIINTTTTTTSSSSSSRSTNNNSTNNNERRPRSNLAALLEHQQPNHVSSISTPAQNQPSQSQDRVTETIESAGVEKVSIANSAPSHIIPQNVTKIMPPPERISCSTPLYSNPLPSHKRTAFLSPATQSEHGNIIQKNQRNPSVRRCISSKELGTLAPPTGSPFAAMLYKREILQAEHQQRLLESRQVVSSNQSQHSSGASLALTQDNSQGSFDSGDNRKRTQLKNESRNRRKAEHTKAVINDLCEIVTDLFIAESKLLNASSYGVASSIHRDQVLKNVKDFVSALPPRYAIGVDTPSEVLVHMRLMAAARSDHSRAVVHVTHLKDSYWGVDASMNYSMYQNCHLVTISCVDSAGLLEYITKLLGTGGSRVMDADVMLGSDGIVLDRFVVRMKGRLRLDRLSHSIETFLSKAKEQEEGESTLTASKDSSTEKSFEISSISFRGPSGPFYFHAPQHSKQETSPQEIKEEIEEAVPLSQVLAASSSTSAMNTMIPRRGHNGSVRREMNMSGVPNRLLQPDLGDADMNRTSGTEGGRRLEQQIGEDTDSSPRDEDSPRLPSSVSSPQRLLSNRETMIFIEGNPEPATPSIDYVTVPNANTDDTDGTQEDKIIPLIPFDELMLIETLGNGRVSTIYRAAWRTNSVDPVALSNVAMVALKVATVVPETESTVYIDELRREADIAAMLSHPNVCDLVGIAADAECFCLAYDFCEGGSLLSLLSDTRRYYEYLPIALDIANGMAYLHARNIIHRDLKPSNILLTRDHRAKIADFGMSVANFGQELTAETGTYRWMAPEVIRHESYSSNADVYSFGIVFWQLITREVPFATMTPIQAAFAVAGGQRPEIPASTPTRLGEIIRACWDQDSHKRPSFTYIAMALADFVRMTFSPANVGAQTLEIANEMLATVEGNSTINVDFSTSVLGRNWASNRSASSLTNENIGLEI